MILLIGFIATHAELNWDGEEVDANLLGDFLTTRNTGQVNIAGLDKALGTRDSLQQLLGESFAHVSPY